MFGLQRLRALLTRSLLSRLTALIVLATLLSWVSFSLVLLYEVRKETSELLDKQLAAYTDMLWQNLGDDDDLKPYQASHIQQHKLQLAFALYDTEAQLQSSNLAQAIPYQSEADDAPHTLQWAGQLWRICVRQDDERQLIVAEPIRHHRKVVAEISEHLGQTALLALLLLLPLLVFAIRRGLQPLQQVTQALAQRAPDNLAPLTLDVPGEIVPMRDRLNLLFAQVSATLQRERRFTADAAHELRTPLAGLRVQIELAQGSPRHDTRERALGRALEGVDRTTRLVAQLLEMSRLEHGDSPVFSPLNLADLAAQVLQEAGIPAQPPHLLLDQPAQIAGHALLLNLLLRNLLDNAQRYAGEQVLIGIEIHGSELLVFDHGCGVSEETLTRLGERFYRPAGQRMPGAGLGASIVLRIAQLHGATLQFANRPAGGFQVRITFKPL
ncbi:ATP-binding protein [Chitinibacter sp. FCG-7]|uniref:histidine kinase n=1 Tax=Chitinibacter mangrovi TaxID=3153927 RepID=A0AAU7FDH8_9NEIS